MGSSMIKRKRKSVIWEMPRSELVELVANAKTFTEVLAAFNLNRHGNNHNTLKRRLIEEEIPYEHIYETCFVVGSRKLREIAKKAKPVLADVLVENSTYHRGCLKRRLIEEDIIPYKCAICSNKGEWLYNKMVLILDHINGVNNDNRLENLRFLCPNCNSQQSTFCRSNGEIAAKYKKIRDRVKASKKEAEKKFCSGCSKQIYSRSKSGICQDCYSKGCRKVERPDLETLLAEVAASNFCAVGRKYGVSDNAIRKWIKIAQKANFKKGGIVYGHCPR